MRLTRMMIVMKMKSDKDGGVDGGDDGDEDEGKTTSTLCGTR